MIIPRNVKTIAQNIGGKGLVKVQKYSPEILTAVGVAGFVGTVILAARATLKLEDTVDKIQLEIHEIKEGRDTSGKKLAGAYIKGGFELAKLYAPTVALGAVSITSILSAHGIMNRRQAGLVAAYAVLEKGFDEYRKRVIDEFGEDKDKEFLSGVKYTVMEQDGEDKREVQQLLRNDLGEYQRIFGKDNQYWSKNPDANVFFLTSHQNWFNDRLQGRGHVFLNEVLETLGFDHTPAGAVVGWVRDSEKGDGFIDFGADKWENIVYGAHYDGNEGHILLEFNVDGPIWDKI